MDLPESQWWPQGLAEHRYEQLSLHSVVRFLKDEVGPDRVLGPDDHNAACLLQSRADI